MGKSFDLIGQRNQSLTVVAKAEKDVRLNRIMWSCLCDCGNKIKVCTGDWNSGRAKSCGCYRRRKGANHPNFQHGLTKTSEYQYRIRLKRMYGITAEEYDKMLEEQLGKCAICQADQKENRGHTLAVDHCHKSGVVRGLLCHTCNRAIGMLGDSVLRISKALEYLSKHEVKNVSTQ
jgi:hypothetical protein